MEHRFAHILSTNSVRALSLGCTLLAIGSGMELEAQPKIGDYCHQTVVMGTYYWKASGQGHREITCAEMRETRLHHEPSWDVVITNADEKRSFPSKIKAIDWLESHEVVFSADVRR